MDPDISLVSVASSFPGVPQSNVRVKLHEDYNRKSLPSNELNMGRVWALRRKQNPTLYNGSKFRFHAIEVVDNGSNCGVVTFCLGLTGYKDFIATNWADNAPELLESGRADLGNSQAYMSDAVGVSALVQTVDGWAVFMRRSLSVGEAQGLWDVPGGHPEPGEVKGGSTTVEDVTLSDISELDVSKELFESIIREIRDEINIPESELKEPYLMGLSKNQTCAGRPSLQFFVECTLQASEVRELYRAGGPEAEESTGLKLIPLSDVFKLEGSDMWKTMAPSGKGSVKLYTSMKNNPSHSQDDVA